MHLDCNCKQEKASFYGMEAEAVWGSEAWEKKESRKDAYLCKLTSLDETPLLAKTRV